MSTLAQDVVKEMFDYVDGELLWRVSTNRRIKIGSKAGKTDDQGRITIGLNGKYHKAHRIIFLWHHGYLPDYIDHIDGNPSNNRFENLRDCTLTQNQCNRIIGRNNTSGIKGVYFSNRSNKWVAEVTYKRVKHYGGSFECIKKAEAAADELRASLHKDYARFA